MDWVQDLAAAIRIDQVALAGIVTVTVILILRGYLVPKATVDDIRGERDAWKQAYLTESKAGTVKDGQINELMELARTSNHALTSLPGGDRGTPKSVHPTAT